MMIHYRLSLRVKHIPYTMQSSAEEIRNNKIAAMPAPLGEVHYHLWNDVVWLHVKRSEFQELYGSGHETIALLNATAPTFFGRLQHTIWEDLLLHICRLTDRPHTFGNQNLTVQQLPLLVDDEPLDQKVAHLVDQAVDKTSFARDWRNRHLAHNDLDRALDPERQPLAEASTAKIDAAMRAIAKAMNEVEYHYESNRTAYTATASPYGARELLYHLRNTPSDRSS